MKPVVERLMGKTIISVQAYEDTPLYGPQNMRVMAQSVLMGGAEGLRACWPQDIRAIRAVTDKPIVGIYKDFPEGQNPLDAIYITPTLERAKEVVEAGADMVTIGSAVTRPHLITERFVACQHRWRAKAQPSENG